MNIAEDKLIDKYALDTECAKQASLYHTYMEAQAEAEFEYDKAKNKLAVKEAEVAYAIRIEGKTKDGVKVTVDSVKEAVILDPGVRGLQKDVTECAHEVKIIKAAVAAMEHKKSMLSSMVKLNEINYWNLDGSSTARDITVVTEDSQLQGLNRRRGAKNG